MPAREQKRIVGNRADKVKFHQAGRLNYHNWRPWRRERVWQPIQNMILWTLSAQTKDVMYDYAWLSSELSDEPGGAEEESKSGIGFLFLCCQGLREDSPPFLNGRGSFQVTNHETAAFDLASEVTESRHDHKFVISVWVFVILWASACNRVLCGGQDVKTGRWPKHISCSGGFFLGQDHTNTCSSWEETRGFEEPSVNQILWEAH